jgi:transcription elongation factor GreA
MGQARPGKEWVTVSEPQATWLTQVAHDRLKHELDELIANRSAIAAEIQARREEGDLAENSGYHAAREEQDRQEARIRQLNQMLSNAKVGEAPTESGVAHAGSVVTIRYEDGEETETFLLAARVEGAHGDLEVYSPNSPLGAALLGAKEGETREYELPNGGTMRVTLLKAEPYRG